MSNYDWHTIWDRQIAALRKKHAKEKMELFLLLVARFAGDTFA